MNTPSPGLLRKALKIVDEIEKLDQQMYRLLSNLELKKGVLTKHGAARTSIAEEELSPLSRHDPTQEEKKVNMAQTNITPPAAAEATSENKSSLPPPPAVPQHEQQSLLIEETGIEQLSVLASRPAEMYGESGEQHEQNSSLF